MAIPPVAVEYQVGVPAEQAAPNVTEPLPQFVAGVTVGAVGLAFVVAFTSVLPDSQPSVVLQLT